MPPKFIVAPARELTGYHPEAQVHTEMSPEHFLWKLGTVGDEEFYVSRGSVAALKQRMMTGQEIDPLFLDYNPFQKKIVGHEGRHRALTAVELGIEKVPVIVYFYDEHGYHDVKNKEGIVYDQSHYIPLEELGEDRVNRELAHLGAERTSAYRRPASQPAGKRLYAPRDLSVHVRRHRRQV